MATFDRNDMETREFVVFEDMIFLDEHELMGYLDTCDAEFETYSFYLDTDEMYQFIDRSEILDLDFNDDEDALYALEQAFDNKVEELMNKYDIGYSRGNRNRDGYRYTLYGTYGNLKKFAAEYCGYLDWSNPGEHLDDCEERAEIDLNSGDDDYILGNLSL